MPNASVTYMFRDCPAVDSELHQNLHRPLEYNKSNVSNVSLSEGVQCGVCVCESCEVSEVKCIIDGSPRARFGLPQDIASGMILSEIYASVSLVSTYCLLLGVVGLVLSELRRWIMGGCLTLFMDIRSM